VWTNDVTVEGGKPRLLWVTPSKGGAYTIDLSAKDLAGNEETTTGTIKVTAPSKSRQKSPAGSAKPSGTHRAPRNQAARRTAGSRPLALHHPIQSIRAE
jgi:hypothetical protein